MDLDALHAHSVEQSVDQVSQERVKHQEEGMHNEVHVNLAEMHQHVGNN